MFQIIFRYVKSTRSVNVLFRFRLRKMVTLNWLLSNYQYTLYDYLLQKLMTNSSEKKLQDTLHNDCFLI